MGGLASVVATPQRIELAPREVAAALVEATDIAGGGATQCPTYPAVLVTPPRETRSVRIDQGLPGCSGLEVHPVVPGTTGSPP